MKKTLTLMLVAALLLSILLTSCTPAAVLGIPFLMSGLTPEETTPEDTTPEITTPEITTPDITTPEQTPPVENPPEINKPTIIIPPEFQIKVPVYDGDGITDENVLVRANIITGDREAEIYAGQELSDYLTKKGVTIDDGGFPIFVCTSSLLGDDSFFIEATLRGDEACMTILGGNDRGVLYGVYKFLEEYAGIRYFTADLEVIPEGDIVLRDGALLSYSPYFEYRHTSWHCSAVKEACSWCVKNGLNGNGHIPPELGDRISYAPGLNVHTLGKLTETGEGASPNPCLSSEENYQKVLKNVRAILEENPDSHIVSISQNDNNTYCTCEACAAVDAEEGSPAGLMLRFVNRLAEELEKDYPNLVIDTLAYNYTQAAPQKTVPRHNVCVRICSIRVCFMHPMAECNDAKGPNGVAWTRTSTFLNDFLDWGKICDRIYVWDYTTNFAYYIAPFSNFGAIRENMILYYENGVRGMFDQGNSQSVSGEFGELRAYLLAKLMWNPYMSEEEYYHHMDEFLAAYYGEGWEGIRAFIDLTTELAGNEGSCINIYEAPLNSITAEEYLQYEAQIEAWWNTAEELAGDRLEAVKRSRLQWRYIQLLLHPDDEACAQFVADVNGYGIRWAESDKNNKPLNEMFTNLYPVGGETGGGPQDGEDPMNPQ